MTHTVLTIEPAYGFLGAEIDLDLSHPFEATTRAALNDALDTHLALFFRGQTLDSVALKRVTEVFAPLVRVPYIMPSPGDPDIIAILKEASEVNISNFGGNWHSDFSFLEQPPGGLVLYALEIPPFGCDTLWANQAAAYEWLSDDLKAQTEGKRAIHIGAPYGVKAPPKL